jgi:hypothetical protein
MSIIRCKSCSKQIDLDFDSDDQIEEYCVDCVEDLSETLLLKITDQCQHEHDKKFIKNILKARKDLEAINEKA